LGAARSVLTDRFPVVPVAAFAPSPAPFVVLMALGFLVGVGGHVYGSRPAIATGIGLILIATLLLPLALYATD
jgi:hypothetical protein